MKVLHVLNTGKYSGAENVVITLIHALEGEVECAYTSPDGPIKDILQKEKITYFPISSVAVTAGELRKILLHYQPDILHTHDYNAGIMAGMTGTRIPIINHLHNNTPWLKNICPKSLAYIASCARYKKILTVSDAVMDEFVFGSLVAKKSMVVGNPLDLSKILKRADEEDRLDDPSDIIFLGRLSPPKNPFFFLEIIADIVKKKKDLRVAMVGAGELQKEVEAKIAELNLVDHVKLYGFQKNPYGLLANARMMCMPSKWEGFGLAAVEGLAFGKPVVASSVGGLKNIVNEQCGKLCESKEEYLVELERLLTDASYYRSKSEGARKRAGEYDNIISYAQQIKEVYCTISGKELME